MASQDESFARKTSVRETNAPPGLVTDSDEERETTVSNVVSQDESFVRKTNIRETNAPPVTDDDGETTEELFETNRRDMQQTPAV